MALILELIKVNNELNVSTIEIDGLEEKEIIYMNYYDLCNNSSYVDYLESIGGIESI